MTNLLKTLLLAFLLIGFGTTATYADAPRWVRKGVKSLNQQRSNDTYTFVKLNMHDFDRNGLKEHHTDALKTYVEDTYNPKFGSVKISKIADGQHPEFLVTYLDAQGNENNIEAMLVDEYMEYDDFDLNVFQYEYEQLYAVSKPNVKPVYDKFGHTTNYNGKAVVMSLVPGLGQIDKGQKTKGRVILGGEITLIGAGLIFEHKRYQAKKNRDDGVPVWDSWNSKRQAWQNFEIGAFGAAAILYVYNLIDAAVSTGASQVTVQKASPAYKVTPFATTNEVGVSFVMNF